MKNKIHAITSVDNIQQNHRAKENLFHSDRHKLKNHIPQRTLYKKEQTHTDTHVSTRAKRWEYETKRSIDGADVWWYDFWFYRERKA